MRSIYSCLVDAAVRQPDKLLYVFPETRWNSADSLTYSLLAERAARAARAISSQTRPGDRALLLFPTGPEFCEAFLGCVACGVIPVPLRTPNLRRNARSLDEICHDCAPTLILADDATARLLRTDQQLTPALAPLPVMTANEWRGAPSEFPTLTFAPHDTVFLQYTSGSTARPKGVQVTHANLLANVTMIRDQMQVRTGEDSSVTWLPHYHDMGLVGSYLTTIFTNLTCTCLPPEEFAFRPASWLQAIAAQRADICGCPDFGYQLCAEKISDEEMSGLDLSAWRVAFVGAERIREETLRLFARRFSAWGFGESSFFPCYGLGEATLMATGGPAGNGVIVRTVSKRGLAENRIEPAPSRDDELQIVGSGATFASSTVSIRDPETGTPLAEGSIGEIHLCSESVTPGYFQRDDLNSFLFRDISENGEERRFLRTGDLGFLSDQHLFVTGRLKELIIVRGRNLYPEDVEHVVQSAHPSLQPRGTVAFSVDQNGLEAFVIASELKRTARGPESFEEILGAIRSAVALSFGISPAEIVLLRQASVPRTSSGKPRRLMVRESYLKGTLEMIPSTQPSAES
ncbi:fatty acyl-AMP ligase [Schlesneria sp. T3-172]|uniref:fatty acyl-AMP ligase n=1 Tax=Schlesneria sphaerica TaxID=3373610 RepID=UPI0037C7ECEB